MLVVLFILQWVYALDEFDIPWIMGCQKPNSAPKTNLALDGILGLGP
jgi:hypothetical protein